MITFDVFLIFLATASLPVIYLLLMSRWIEPEYRKGQPRSDTKPSKGSARDFTLIPNGFPMRKQSGGSV